MEDSGSVEDPPADVEDPPADVDPPEAAPSAVDSDLDESTLHPHRNVPLPELVGYVKKYDETNIEVESNVKKLLSCLAMFHFNVSFQCFICFPF